MRVAVTLDDIRAAHERIRDHIHRTPVLTSAFFDGETGAELFFKCENLQKTGSFKFRGACNAVLSLSEEDASRGVVTGSSGNHGQALACAARMRGIKACIVMPDNAPKVKVRAVRGYGGEVVFADPPSKARLVVTERIRRETGAVMIHPFNNPRIIAGQGTATAELCEQIADLDAVLVPVSGGGLASGTAIAATSLVPGIKVYGVEPAVADDARRSLEEGRVVEAGNPPTIADGLRASLGDLTFPILRNTLAGILTVSEEQIVAAMRQVWERMKIIVEPSAAVVIAAALAYSAALAGKRVGLIVSGGNVDLDRLPWSA